jgi:hypothetical protein
MTGPVVQLVEDNHAAGDARAQSNDAAGKNHVCIADRGGGGS